LSNFILCGTCNQPATFNRFAARLPHKAAFTIKFK
jgi:hypothetical protein